MIRSVCSAFVNAPLFRKRSADAKLLWYTLYLHQAQHLCGLMRLDVEHMALDVGFPVARTRAALAELVQHKLCQVDEAQDLVCVLEMTSQAAKVVQPKWTGYKAVERYLVSLGKSTLCHTVCDTLSIPYAYPIDTLLLDPGSGSDSGTGSDPATGDASGSAPLAPPVGLSGHSEQEASKPAPAAKNAQEAQQGALIPLPPRTAEKVAKPRKTATQSIVSEIWEAYSAAFAKRYGVKFTWNDKVGGQLAQFASRIPRDEAAATAAFYVSHPSFANAVHSVDLLLKCAERLNAEWRRGQPVTRADAQ